MAAMRMSRWLGLGAVALLASACATSGGGGPDDDDDDPPDASATTPDGPEIPIDAPPIDAPPIDAPPIDAPPIDAMPIDAPPIDAMPIDAMPIDGPPIDAPCTIQTVQLLANPSFDASPMGTGWVQAPYDAAYPLIADDIPGAGEHTAPNAVWMGGFLSATDNMYQLVAIPASTTALQLRGQRWIGTEETGTTVYDSVRLQIRSSTGTMLEQLVQWSNANSNAAWAPFVLSTVSPYAGQQVRVYLESSTDSTLNTNFFFDTFVLEATVCQ
jgi:hypothetical protein